MKTALFLTAGFEETEALVTVDILRRAGVDVRLVSLTEYGSVEGSHGIIVKADMVFEKADLSDFDVFILPGGPGTDNYYKNDVFIKTVIIHCDKGKLLAAICAAPAFIANLGLLQGKTAVCYPSMENTLIKNGAEIGKETVVQDGNFITSKGPATTMFFALKIVEVIKGKKEMEKVKKAFLADMI